MLHPEVIAKRLIELRGENTREWLADKLGLSVSAIKMYESGSRIPKDDIKIRIANLFGKTVQEIFFDVKPHNSRSAS